MATKFPFQPIPMAFAPLIGVPDEGTRIFRREGDFYEMREWFDALCQHIGPCVSPGGASIYAGVTRAGVYRRLKAAGLTAFCFHLIGKQKTLFGGEKKLKEFAIVYIPVSECKAWGKELEDRVRKIEETKRQTEEDDEAFEEADPGVDNPDSSFLNYDPKDKKKKGMRYLNQIWDKDLRAPADFDDGKEGGDK